jgi:hypothetical protein
MTPALPDDLQAFLRDGRQLEYDPSACEPGQVLLLPLGKHTLAEVWIDGKQLVGVADDPHAGNKGYYAVPAINLVGSCEAYDPEHVLLWLPEEGLYGTWDCDHWELCVFPRAAWTDIAADPLPYLNAQWYPSPAVAELFVPWPKYPFRSGRPF